MKSSEVLDYLRATRHVEGWFFPIDAYLFAIGVHHGKTAIFLARMAAAGESVRVCDVFDEQALNVDHSGEGNRAVFDRHWREHAGDAVLRVFAKLSSALTPDDTSTRCRFVHIDGGHRAEDVMNDLAVAERALLPNGIVAVDDVFNPNWPGVSEGFYRFFNQRPDAFAPIAIGGNKVLLARRGSAAFYDVQLADIGRWSAFIEPQPFGLDFKGWMGRNVLTAIRRAWVDLDPAGAARLHDV